MPSKVRQHCGDVGGQVRRVIPVLGLDEGDDFANGSLAV